MPVTEASHNITVLAKQYRTTLFSDHWFIKHSITREEQIFGERFAGDEAAILQTSLFMMNSTRERFNVVLKPNHAAEEIIKPLEAILRAIPDPGFIAVGLNHQWVVTPEHPKEDEVASLSRHNFMRDSAFSRALGSNGVWTSDCLSPWQNAILRVKTTAMFSEGDPTTPPIGLNVDFNYHFKLSGVAGAVDEAADLLLKYPETWKHSFDVSAKLLEGF